MTVAGKVSDQKLPLKNWQEFWSSGNFWTYPELFKVNADILYKRTHELLKLNKMDRVLDIGCGPGFYEALISSKVGEVVALDTSESFLAICKENNKSHENVQIHKLNNDYTDLSFVGEQRFSVFLSISVIQYYKTYDEIEALIRSAQAIASPGAKMLIADVPVKRSWWENALDFMQTILLSIQGKYFWTLIAKILKEWRAILNYKSHSSEIMHLNVSRDDLNQLTRKMNLKVEFLEENFSICSNRLNLLIHF